MMCSCVGQTSTQCAALFQPIGTLKGVGQKRSAAYEKLGIQTPYDLLYHIPRQYLDYSHPIPVIETPLQAVSPICVTIQKKMVPQFLRKGLTVYKAIAADDSGTITIVIYNNNYAFEALHIGQTYCMSGKITGNFLRREISSPHCIPAGSTHLIHLSADQRLDRCHDRNQHAAGTCPVSGAACRLDAGRSAHGTSTASASGCIDADSFSQGHAADGTGSPPAGIR